MSALEEEIDPGHELAPRMFRSPRYLREVEPGTYATYFDILVQEGGGPKEKVGPPVGPLSTYRAAAPDEEPDLKTVVPGSMELLALKALGQPLEEKRAVATALADAIVTLRRRGVGPLRDRATERSRAGSALTPSE